MSHIHQQGGKYSHTYIRALLARVRIEGVIGDFVTLKRVNEHYSYGLCSFHKERTPSFSVSQDGQFYHCFGCHSHGNAIDFLLTLKDTRSSTGIFIDDESKNDEEVLAIELPKEFTYLDAVRFLAKKYRYWPSQHKRLKKRLKRFEGG
jgi:CHC2 zinc finger